MGKKESLNKIFEEEVKIQSDLDTPEITEMGNNVSPTPSNTVNSKFVFFFNIESNVGYGNI